MLFHDTGKMAAGSSHNLYNTLSVHLTCVGVGASTYPDGKVPKPERHGRMMPDVHFMSSYLDI